MRKPLIAGNWKMYKTPSEAVTLVKTIKSGASKLDADVDIVICPPFTALMSAHEVLVGSSISLGAQNMHYETEGAFTGETSPLMLKDAGCRYVVLGHSERRAFFHETDELINKKVKTACKFNLVPIVCIGETLAEREAGKEELVVQTQFSGSLAGLSAEEIDKVVIAYEPVWAIGTGKTATPQEAQRMHAFIRKLLQKTFGDNIMKSARILYGGSVKPDNISELIKQTDIDGALVGGASLKAESFIQIIQQSIVSETVQES